jgi:hypothetical protein
MRMRKAERVYPHEIDHLPGLGFDSVRNDKGCIGFRDATDDPSSNFAARRDARKLQDMCLRRIAQDWEFLRQYEKNNLAGLPTKLRMLLLSNIAVYGPEDGVGFEGLKHVLMLPDDDE